MQDFMLELMKMMPPEYVERLVQLQNQTRSGSVQELPQKNSKATPPSSQPTGIYRKNIYG
jgi:hypothetical protein